MLNSFKELEVWKRSMELVDEVYKITKQLPASETFGLCSQMQRNAVSIPSNIAEGYKRNHRQEFIQFLGIANASAAEFETQLIICQRIYPNYDYRKAEMLLLEVEKMLHVLIRSLKNKGK